MFTKIKIDISWKQEISDTFHARDYHQDSKTKHVEFSLDYEMGNLLSSSPLHSPRESIPSDPSCDILEQYAYQVLDFSSQYG